MIIINDCNYELSRHWLRSILIDLNGLMPKKSSLPSSSPSSAKNYQQQVKHGEASVSSSKAAKSSSSSVAGGGVDQRLAKKQDELAFKSIDAKLSQLFAESPQPYWLNILLIENCKDYATNRYNSLAAIIARSFEVCVQKNKLGSKFQLDNNIKLAAFYLSTKHSLLLVDSISKTYELNNKTSNAFLLPFVRERIAKYREIKDKAILINSLMMHDHFDTIQVLLHNL